MKAILIVFLILISFLENGDANQINLTGNHTGGNVSLIPREILFGNPDKATVLLSPDGSKISYLAPVNGVLNVWVGPVADIGPP